MKPRPSLIVPDAPKFLQPKKERLPERKRMTLAIGAKCEGGAILYADRRVVAADGSAGEACKVFSRAILNGKVALATATANFRAAEGFASQLLAGLEGRDFASASEMSEHVRRGLLDWSSPYFPEEAQLLTQFVMAAEVAGEVQLYFLEPRNTVSPIRCRRAIGSGERVVEPMFDSLIPEDYPFTANQMMFRLAYLMRHAKKQEAYVGGGSDAVFVPQTGSMKIIHGVELWFAEEQCEFVDECLQFTLSTLMGFDAKADIERLADRQRGLLVTFANTFRNHVRFTALENGDADA